MVLGGLQLFLVGLGHWVVLACSGFCLGGSGLFLGGSRSWPGDHSGWLWVVS